MGIANFQRDFQIGEPPIPSLYMSLYSQPPSPATHYMGYHKMGYFKISVLTFPHSPVCLFLSKYNTSIIEILKHSFSLFRSPLLHSPLAVTFLFLAGTPKKKRYHYGHLSYSSLTLSTQFLTRHTYQLRLPDSQAYHLKH